MTGPSSPRPAADPSTRSQFAKKSAQALWGKSPAGSSLARGLLPGSREFFEAVVAARDAGEQSWLGDVVPFESFAGSRVLEIGCGAGYDAVKFLDARARYVGIDLVPENARRTRRHLSYYDYDPQVAAGDAEFLPFATGTFDAAFSNGVLHHTPDMGTAFREIARVLKSEAPFWLIVYHKSSIFYWVTLFLVDHLLRGGYRRQSFADRLSMIENPDHAGTTGRPLVVAYDRRTLKKMLGRAGFAVRSLRVRKLAREDLPGLRGFSRLWPLIPDRWLSAVGHLFGWYLICEARKMSATCATRWIVAEASHGMLGGA